MWLKKKIGSYAHQLYMVKYRFLTPFSVLKEFDYLNCDILLPVYFCLTCDKHAYL